MIRFNTQKKEQAHILREINNALNKLECDTNNPIIQHEEVEENTQLPNCTTINVIYEYITERNSIEETDVTVRLYSKDPQDNTSFIVEFDRDAPEHLTCALHYDLHWPFCDENFVLIGDCTTSIE